MPFEQHNSTQDKILGRSPKAGRSKVRSRVTDRANSRIASTKLNKEIANVNYSSKAKSKTTNILKERVLELVQLVRPKLVGRRPTVILGALQSSQLLHGEPINHVKLSALNRRSAESGEQDVVPIRRHDVSSGEYIDLQTDVRKIREKLGLSQEDFSRTYGIPLSTLRNWEQGRRKPDAAVSLLLHLISNDPKEIAKQLSAVKRLGSSDTD